MDLSKTKFTINKETNSILVNREFNAPIELVWKAWTDSKIMDLWWAPKPWKAETKSMNFKEGGSWLYCMLGPAGEKHWACAEFTKIEFQKTYQGIDYFCDESGIKNTEFPTTKWENHFSSNNNATVVNVKLTFSSLAELEKLTEMGFKEGFAMAHTNLDELILSKTI